jgi:hypothetical protein
VEEFALYKSNIYNNKKNKEVQQTYSMQPNKPKCNLQIFPTEFAPTYFENYLERYLKILLNPTEYNERQILL